MRGLILEGGGMRAGFVAGALMAFMDQGFTDFDVAVAVFQPASPPWPILLRISAGKWRRCGGAN